MKRILVVCAFVLFAESAHGQTNTDATVAADYFWGQKATSRVDGASATQFWFYLSAVQGRSYCAEAGNYEAAYGDKPSDTVLTVFQYDGTTVIANNDDTYAGAEPRSSLHSRACWVNAQPSGQVYVKLFPQNAAVVNAAVTLRFVETTLFCPWFFVAGDYNAFSLVRNTSLTALSGVVFTWRGLNGVVAGTTTVSIPGNGTVILNARDFVNPALFSNGSIEIAHSGSPDQLQGSTTTLSGTTGLGFDAQFTQRKTW